jgi:hypothetical protein
MNLAVSQACVQPCELYFNIKTARQQLFSASAALFSLTGEKPFLEAANEYYDTFQKDVDFGGFTYFNKCALPL